MTPLERLELEAIPCNFGKPKVWNGDGPTARYMAIERQRRLWAGEFNDDEPTANVSLPVVAGSRYGENQ